MEPAPIWTLAYPLIILLGLAGAAVQAANYLRPYWTKRKSLARVGMSAASLVIFALLLRADEWFLPRSGAAWPDGASAEGVLAIVNGGCQIGLVAAALLSAFELLRELHRLNARRQAAHAVDSAV